MANLDLYYYKKENSQLEMDFFVRTAESLVPIEVKAKDGATASLNNLIKYPSYEDVRFGIKLCNKNVGFNGRFYTIPYFCAFLLKRFLREDFVVATNRTILDGLKNRTQHFTYKNFCAIIKNMMLTSILENFKLNNSTTQQLNNSTTQQLNNSTTQQLNNSDDIVKFYKNSRFYKSKEMKKADFVRFCVQNLPFLFLEPIR